MRCKILILLSCLLILSCSGKREKTLDVKISQNDMVKIIRDINRAYYMVESSPVNDTIKEKMKKDYKNSICQHYNTTPEQYDKDLKTYLANDKQFKAIINKDYDVSKDLR